MASPTQSATNPIKVTAPRSSLRPLLKTAGVGFVGGIILWGVGDVVGEFTTFLKLRERGLALANDSQELKDQIGHPFTTGPWYNGRIGFTAGGNIAQCTFQLQGTKQITDVTVKGMKGTGTSFNRILYNIIGPGAWTVIDCTAMFPSGGGLVQPRSLLPKQSPRQNAADGGGGQQGHDIAGGAGHGIAVGADAAPKAAAAASQELLVAGAPVPKAGRTWWGWVRGQPEHPGNLPGNPS